MRGIKITEKDLFIFIQISFVAILLIFISIIPLSQSVYNTSSTDYNVDEFIKYRNDWSINKDNLHGKSQLITLNSDRQDKNQESENQGDIDLVRGLSNSSWPMSCHDLHHTCQSPYSTENNPGTEKWRFRTSSDIESAAVVDEDEIVYFTAVSNARIYAIYPNGTLKWSYQTDGLQWSTPAIDEDGNIYFTSWDAGLYALYPNGTRKWRFGAGAPITSSPAIADDGTIYFGCYNKKLFAVNSNGSKKWDFYGGGEILSDPAVGDDGTIYFGSSNERLYALYPNGTFKWDFVTGADIKGHPSIGPDGTVYCPSFDGYLYALYPNGTLKWQAETGDEVAGAVAAIGNDGTIYVGTELLRAFYPNGTLKWSYDIDGYLWGTGPAISDDGTIYIANDKQRSLMAINSDGTLKWQKEISNYYARSSPIIAEDGTIYVGSSWIDEDSFWYGSLHVFGRGELNAEAGGPYEVYAGIELQFTADIFGGTPPYACHWDFGDGNTSNQEDPSHIYYTLGTFNATFTVIDAEENVSVDYTEITVTNGPPIITMLKPKEGGLYLFDFLLKDEFVTNLIIGKITIEVEATQIPYGIDYVEFYIDNELQSVDSQEPYEWLWRRGTLFQFQQTITAKAYDTTGNYSTDILGVWRFL